MLWLDKMLEWLPWHRKPLPVRELDEAIAANAAAYRGVVDEEALLTGQLQEQQHKTQEMLSQIRERTNKCPTNPGVVTIAHVLKSLEKPS